LGVALNVDIPVTRFPSIDPATINDRGLQAAVADAIQHQLSTAIDSSEAFAALPRIRDAKVQWENVKVLNAHRQTLRDNRIVGHVETWTTFVEPEYSERRPYCPGYANISFLVVDRGRHVDRRRPQCGHVSL
jgi:hypothetical protein